MFYRKKPEPRPQLVSTVWMKPGDLPNALQETWPQLIFSKDKRHFWLRVASREAKEWMPVSDEFIDSQWDNVIVPFDSPLHQEVEGDRVDIKTQLDTNSTLYRLILKHLHYWGIDTREVNVQLAYLQPWAEFTYPSGMIQPVWPGAIVLTNVETGAFADILHDNEELLANYEPEHHEELR